MRSHESSDPLVHEIVVDGQPELRVQSRVGFTPRRQFDLCLFRLGEEGGVGVHWIGLGTVKLFFFNPLRLLKKRYCQN